MSAAKSRGVIFTDFSVRAILAGRKTQTRRLVKLRPSDGRCSKDCCGAIPERAWADKGIGAGGYLKVPCLCGASQRVRGPFGDIGDRLYVKESTGRPWHHAQPSVFYRATDSQVDNHPDFDGRWVSPMFMRRSDARIELEIIGRRVERLRQITNADAIAEGAKRSKMNWWTMDVARGPEWGARSPRGGLRQGVGRHPRPWPVETAAGCMGLGHRVRQAQTVRSRRELQADQRGGQGALKPDVQDPSAGSPPAVGDRRPGQTWSSNLARGCGSKSRAGAMLDPTSEPCATTRRHRTRWGCASASSLPSAQSTSARSRSLPEAPLVPL